MNNRPCYSNKNPDRAWLATFHNSDLPNFAYKYLLVNTHPALPLDCRSGGNILGLLFPSFLPHNPNSPLPPSTQTITKTTLHPSILHSILSEILIIILLTFVSNPAPRPESNSIQSINKLFNTTTPRPWIHFPSN